MICASCGMPTRTIRDARNLFSRQHHHICRRCIRAYPVVPLTETLLSEGGEIRLTTLVGGTRRTDPMAHMSLMGPLISHVARVRPGDVVLWYDTCTDQDLRLLGRLSIGDIHALTVYRTLQDKGETP